MLENEVRWVHYTQGVQKVVTSVVARGWGMINVADRVQLGSEVAEHSSDLIAQSVAEWSNPASLQAP